MIYKCRIIRLLKRAIKKTTTKSLNDLLKRITMYMTLGVDVSALFTDMCLISQYPDTLAKKMIYLYLGNYAESNPNLALLAVNTFIKDCDHQNPKVRGLVLRSLCSLKSQLNTNEVKNQVVKMLEDTDPYVQKTAIFGCLKIYYVDKSFLEDYKLYDVFYNMLKSNESSVVISVINALNEMLSDEGGMAINSKIIIYLLNRFKEFDDYGQSVILELCLKYKPKDKDQKLQIMNIIDYRLKSSNCHLVLSVIKVFLQYNIEDENIFPEILAAVKNSLITLLMSSQDEVKYSILCNIYELIKIGGPEFLQQDYKRFFCEGDDKSYIQEKKLQILQLLVTEDSFDDIFNELSQYTNEICVSLAQESIMIIGQLGKQFKNRINAVLKLFTSILDSNKSYLYDQMISALKTIFSSNIEINNSDEFTTLFGKIEDLIDFIKSEQSQISLIWLLSRFYNKIENSTYLLEKFVNDIESGEKSDKLKLQLINSVVFVFLKKPKEVFPVLHQLFNYIMESEKESYIVVNKCKLYSTAMKKDIKGFERFFNKFFEEVNRNTQNIKEKKATEINLNNLSIIYQKEADNFIKPLKYFTRQRLKQDEVQQDNIEVEINDDEDEPETTPNNVNDIDELDMMEDEDFSDEPVTQKPKPKPKAKKNSDIDFLGLDLDDDDEDEDDNILDMDLFKELPKTKKEPKEAPVIQYESDNLSPDEFQDLWMERETR